MGPGVAILVKKQLCIRSCYSHVSNNTIKQLLLLHSSGLPGPRKQKFGEVRSGRQEVGVQLCPNLFLIFQAEVGMVPGWVLPDSARPIPGLGLGLGLRVPHPGRIWAEEANPD
jgi:hypothetical protein